MTSQAFSFTTGTWVTSHSLHPVVDDNYGSSGSGGVYRWDIQNSSSTEHVGSGYILQYDGSQSEPWSVSSSVWSGGATISRPSTGVIRVTAQSIDRGTWTETAAFLNGVMPSSGGGTSTEGVAVESGSLTLVNGDVVYVVDSTSITHTYYLKIDGLFAGGSHSNWQHTAGTESGGTFPNAQDGKYTLEYEESLFPFNHIKIAELTVGKKVFCNFW